MLRCSVFYAYHFAAVSIAAAEGDYELSLASGPYGASSPADINATVLQRAGGRGYDGFLAVIDGAAPHFHAEGQCDSVRKTSEAAAAAGCRYATNGGPFNDYTRGGCIGILISHGEVMSTDWNTSYPSFGLTSRGEWIVGHISEAIASDLAIKEALTGFNWLVRGGTAVADVGGAKAGRTAVGVDSSGRLVMLQVDGCEHCVLGNSGLTLRGIADLLVELGVEHAINMDGGGSCSMAVDGNVMDKPTCMDVLPLTCERPVTSVVCVAGPAALV